MEALMVVCTAFIGSLMLTIVLQFYARLNPLTKLSSILFVLSCAFYCGVFVGLCYATSTKLFVISIAVIVIYIVVSMMVVSTVKSKHVV